MHTQNVNTAAQKSSERWVKKVSLILAGAADRGHMSVAFGREAAAHYGTPWTLRNAVSDWLSGFAEGLKNPH